ncbi:MAG: hypothetical protein ACKERG_03975 [Candidatus Hodgkinia cicadicola]
MARPWVCWVRWGFVCAAVNDVVKAKSWSRNHTRMLEFGFGV